MTLSRNCLAKEIVSEAAIVGMIVVYVDSLRGSAALKNILDLHSFNGSSRFLEMHVFQATAMINEDWYCDLVSFYSRDALKLTNNSLS